MIETPKLKPQFALIQPADDLSIILSELSRHIFHGAGFHRILQLLDGMRTADAIVDEALGIEPPEVLYYRLLQLEKEHFLEDAGREHSPATILLETTGSSTLPEVEAPSPGSEVKLVFLGQCSNRDAISRSLEDAGVILLDDAKQSLVVVDDYLEPELQAFNELAIADKREWILYKPAGTRILIGPGFVPGSTPCYNCLATILRGHRYEEALMNRGSDKYQPLRLSRGWTSESLTLAASLLTNEIHRFPDSQKEVAGECSILSFDFTDPGKTRHILRKLEGCSVCGVSSSEEGISSRRPLELQRERKYPYIENGSRIRSASDTLQYLQGYVSRISGVIGSVREFHPDIKIFGRHFQATFPAERTIECLRPDKADRFGVTQGKGITGEQATVSAMAEAAERYCARFRDSDPTFTAALNDINEKVIRLDELILLSERQKESFEKTCAEQNLKNPFLPSTSIDWSPAWSLTAITWRFVPASTAYYPFPRNREYLVPAWTTNGLSAGSCLEEAILQGLLEIIERDAFTIWWYNRLIPIGLDIHSFESPEASLLSNRLDSEGWDLHLLDLTTDLGVPVIAAVGISRTDPDRDPLFGFGANLNPATALSRALGEMVAEWKSNANIFRMNENSMLYLGKRFTELDFIKPASDAPLLDASAKVMKESDYLMEDIRTLTDILKQKGMETLVMDLSRNEAPLRIVRVLVTGMRQILPHFGAGRLFDVPVLTGQLTDARSEEKMNPMPFWHLLNRVHSGLS